MKAKLTTNMEEFVQSLKDATEEQAEGMVRAIATVQISNIRNRLEKGIGLNDGPLPEYTGSYKKRREDRGRQTRTRDLLFTGRMIRSITILSVRKAGSAYVATIGFASPSESLKAAGNQALAPWFGISNRDRARIAEYLRKVKST